MRRKSLVVLSLLLLAALMAGIGTGAIDVFSANRAAAMKVVNDAEGIIGIAGDGLYAVEVTSGRERGTLKLDFTELNENFAGKGFNPQAKSEFHDVFTITNQSAKTVYVWLEAEGWDSQHNAGLAYRINETDGVITFVDDWYGKTQPGGRNLLSSTGMNFVDGVGKNAYVELDPGESFTVNIVVNTNLANGYGSPGSKWDHTVKVKANTEAPTQTGQYNPK
ncbi:MAG: hypothetical protein GX021_05500 [Tissierellia bacterium]|nr:hypothetical protein [Tissierellia bacterium]